jgi:hypothetical protein
MEYCIEVQHSYCVRFLKVRGWSLKASRADTLMWVDPDTKFMVSLESAMEIQLEREVKASESDSM